MRKIKTINDAINHIADMCNLDTDGATWVYENSGCPDWDDAEFTAYDFMADEYVAANIPAEFI